MSGFFSDAKQSAKDAAQTAEDKAKELRDAPKSLAIPPFADIAKAANDLLNKDFYHTAAANLEVKNKTPNGVNYTVKAKSAHDGPVTGSLEGKYADKPSGITLSSATLSSMHMVGSERRKDHQISHAILFLPPPRRRRSKRGPGTLPDRNDLSPVISVLIRYMNAGATATLTWTTLNALDAKLELDGTVAKDVKAEFLSTFKPDSGSLAFKGNLFVKQPGLHFRALTDFSKGPVTTVDLVIGHEGFLVGGEAAYDIQKAALTRYSAAVAYQQNVHHAAITSTNNFSVFAASYYNKVNENVEAGAKATWDSKTGSTVGLELASKYKLDPTSFVKGKVNDQGIAALAYNVQVKQGFTFGIGTSFDVQKLNEGGHKVGANFVFEN